MTTSISVSRLWVLGASDPEMAAIEILLRDAGENVVYARVDGVRVHPGNAYRAECPEGATHVVECCGTIPDGVTRIDHHRLGDPGYGRPPEEFLAASSVGQVVAELARLRPWSFPRHTPVAENHYPGAAPGLIMAHRYQSGTFWSVVADYPADEDEDPTAGQWWSLIPTDIVLTAAADHCLAAAYRGQCPGVNPDELMAWRARSRAEFQGRPVEAVLADIEAARAALRTAPKIMLGGIVGSTSSGSGDCYCDCSYCDSGRSHCGDGHYCDVRPGAYGHGTDVYARDMRGVRCPELPEASAREGLCFVADGLPGPDGRVKIVCQSGTRDEIEAFMWEWAPAQGLTDIYGDPARGFAGGYVSG